MELDVIETSETGGLFVELGVVTTVDVAIDVVGSVDTLVNVVGAFVVVKVGEFIAVVVGEFIAAVVGEVPVVVAGEVPVDVAGLFIVAADVVDASDPFVEVIVVVSAVLCVAIAT